MHLKNLRIEHIFTFVFPKTVSVEELQKVRMSNSLRQNILIFKYLGYWPPPRSEKSFWAYAIYSANMIFWVLLMWNITQFINFYFIADLEEVAASLYITTCTGVEIIKAYYLVKNSYRTQAVVDSLDRPIFKPKNIPEYELVADVIRYAQFTYIAYKACATLTVFFWATYPVYDANVIRRLPFLAWFPWDSQGSPGYEICYAYQVFGAFCLAWLNITMDSTAGGLMSNVSAQLDLLSYKLIHMYEDTELRLKQHNVKNITPEMVYDEMYISLGECVDHHKNIVDLAENIGQLFTVSVFYQFFISASILCMTMFQLTLVDVLSFEFFSLIFYQICMLLEVAMYCWFGNEVILKSEKVVLAAFSSDWMDCSPHFKQNLLFFMTRLSRPLRLYAGGFFVLSVETFTLIVRSAWSYFAVLRQVHNE